MKITNLTSPQEQVIREDNETQVIEVLSLSKAIETLENYWKKESIKHMLDQGQKLHTPYATYYKP